MRATIAVTIALIAHTGFAGTVKRCGVSFVLPAKWTAVEKVSPDYPDETDIQCRVALRPEGWSARAKRSRWDASDPPVWLMIFGAGTSFEDALDGAGFENEFEEGGGRLGIPGRFGFSEAEPYSAGRFSGLVVRPTFRGFIRDVSTLRENESGLSTRDNESVVMKEPSGRIIGFASDGGTPDEPIDRDAIIAGIAQTLVFEAPKSNEPQRH
ncbi:MAG TPA: hypothetical protein VNN25_26150 [Thermoanaerobaculia bacterium]|nr:hypothetical protein [Thermoanaerobaculia bacterium]